MNVLADSAKRPRISQVRFGLVTTTLEKTRHYGGTLGFFFPFDESSLSALLKLNDFTSNVPREKHLYGRADELLCALKRLRPVDKETKIWFVYIPTLEENTKQLWDRALHTPNKLAPADPQFHQVNHILGFILGAIRGIGRYALLAHSRTSNGRAAAISVPPSTAKSVRIIASCLSNIISPHHRPVHLQVRHRLAHIQGNLHQFSPPQL